MALNGNTAQEAAYQLLAPGVALLGILISAVIVWLKDLGAAAKRSRTIQEANARLEFWSKYRVFSSGSETRPVAPLGAGELIALEEVEFAAAQVRRTRLQQVGEREHVHPIRRFLMLYRMQSGPGRVARICAYSLPIFTLFATSFALWKPHEFIWISEHVFRIRPEPEGPHRTLAALFIRLVQYQVLNFCIDAVIAEWGERNFESNSKKLCDQGE